MNVRVYKINLDVDYMQNAYDKLFELVEKDSDVANQFYNLIKLKNCGKIHEVVRSISGKAIIVSVGLALASIFIEDIRGDVALAGAIAASMSRYAGTCGVKSCVNRVCDEVQQMAGETSEKLKDCRGRISAEITQEEYEHFTSSIILGVLQDKLFTDKVEEVVKQNKRKRNKDNNHSEM